MLSDERLKAIRESCRKASPIPWEWGHEHVEESTDDPELNAMGIHTIPTAFKNIQLKADGEHCFWVELTDTKVGGDVVFDLDFISGAREWVPELLAEIERLRALLGKGRQ